MHPALLWWEERGNRIDPVSKVDRKKNGVSLRCSTKLAQQMAVAHSNMSTNTNTSYQNTGTGLPFKALLFFYSTSDTKHFRLKSVKWNSAAEFGLCDANVFLDKAAFLSVLTQNHNHHPYISKHHFHSLFSSIKKQSVGHVSESCQNLSVILHKHKVYIQAGTHMNA